MINIKPKITKQEWLFAITFSCIFALLTILPYAIGRIYTPEGMVFSEFIANNYDQESYLAWMKQASDGKVFFEDKWTTERHSAVFFHPLFLVSGKLAGILGLKMITAYHAMRVLFGALMLIMLYYFGAHFLKNVQHRKYFLILISVAAGFGFLAKNPMLWHNSYNIMSLDMWVTEVSTFLIILTKPLFSFSLILLLGIFILMLKAFAELERKFAYFAGFLGLILALVHPYDVFSALIVLTVYLLVKKSRKEEYFLFVLFAIISGIGLTYQYLIFTYDPVFKEWAKTVTLTPNPLSFILGFGFSGLLAGFFALSRDQKKDSNTLFLVVWFSTILIASYLPINFQRRMLLGLQVPIVLLSVKYVFEFLLPKYRVKLAPALRHSVTIVFCFALLIIPTNLRYLFDCYRDMKGNTLKYNIYGEDISALEWLEKNAGKNEAVLASKVISLNIPGRAGCRVFAGHYDQTVKYSEKAKLITVIYSGKLTAEAFYNFCNDNRINYIYFGPFEKLLGTPAFKTYPFLTRVYADNSNKVEIYKTNNQN